MQIPQELPRFNVHTLFIVTGSQYARFYYAYENAIDEITDIKVENPHYSDNEGFFMRSGHGEMMGAGASMTDQKEYIKDSFTKKLNELLDIISREIEVRQIVLFSPDYIARDIRESIASKYKDKISKEIHGNYTKQHPIELVHMLY